ncbi:MAG: tRNA (adenosine(37)-N6)-threonylcarbamoyltransferase complex ATPase subunit type 1 TsaE [Solirubrobacterales bacterium]
MAAPAAIERQVTTTSADETQSLGASLAASASPGDLLCLWGELGAGKTQLAKGFGRGLAISDTINSPSFILMAEYPGRLRLFHVDLYRLDGASEAIAGGLLDERQGDGVTLIEWPERLGRAMPADRLDVVIEGSGDEPRHITLRANGPRHARYVESTP